MPRIVCPIRISFKINSIGWATPSTSVIFKGWFRITPAISRGHCAIALVLGRIAAENADENRQGPDLVGGSRGGRSGAGDDSVPSERTYQRHVAGGRCAVQLCAGLSVLFHVCRRQGAGAGRNARHTC